MIYRTIGQLVTVQSNWQKTMQRIGSLELVEAEFERVASNQESGGPVVLGPLARGIELDGVSYGYQSGSQHALQEVTLTIPANRTIALVGESGAGKSTLVDLLTLTLRPTKGEMRIDGVPGPSVQLASWRQQIGYVSQETVVFDDTIANNICLWRGDYNSDREVRMSVEHAAGQACARGFIDELEHQFNTRVGDRGVRLSGGQRQRLFIARELYKNPRLLILDEATSALDSEAEVVIRESVDQLRGSMTIVIIAHRLSTIRNADYIYVIENGRIIEEGNYQQLTSAHHGAFNRMVALQTL